MTKQTHAAPRQLMAFKGDIVTCEKGHQLYKVKQNVLPGEPIKAKHLQRLTKDAQFPRNNVAIKTECHCGAPWMRQKPDSQAAQVHFADGEWRP